MIPFDLEYTTTSNKPWQFNVSDLISDEMIQTCKDLRKQTEKLFDFLKKNYGENPTIYMSVDVAQALDLVDLFLPDFVHVDRYLPTRTLVVLSAQKIEVVPKEEVDTYIRRLK